MKFFATVRRWRRERALTQRAAAKRLGVPYRTFQDWELGNRTPRGLARRLIAGKLSVQDVETDFGGVSFIPSTQYQPGDIVNVHGKPHKIIDSTLAAPTTARAKSQAAPTGSPAATSPRDSSAPRKRRPAGRTRR